MKILAISDPHDHKKVFPVIKKKASSADLILLAGDFTFFEQDLVKILQNFNTLGKPVLIIPGNHEDPKNIQQASDAFDNIFYINGSLYNSGNLSVLAYEGNGFARHDEKFDEAVKDYIPLIKKRKKALGDDFLFVLMTHAPPYGTALDVAYADEHSGNKSIRHFIEQMQPDYAISGHIHETFGKQDKIGNTVVINPGPEGMIITL